VEFPERINTTPAATLTATNAGSSAHERQRISRIRLATERSVWLWNVTIHLTGGLPMGLAKDLDTAKAEFKAAWEELESQDNAGAAGGSLQGDEHSGRRLKDARWP
jgi:hypothetical protein